MALLTKSFIYKAEYEMIAKTYDNKWGGGRVYVGVRGLMRVTGREGRGPHVG